MKTIYIFFYLGGGPGDPYVKPRVTNFFQGSKTTSQSRQMYNKKKKRQFFIYGPQMWRNVHFWLFYSYLGGPGGPLRRTQGYQIFRAVRSHHRADKLITREKNNNQFFIYGPQCEKMHILGYSGGGGAGWPINNRTGPYINLHIKYGSNPIRIV